MTSYIIRRVLLIIPTVFVALSFLFFFFFVLPGDPADADRRRRRPHGRPRRRSSSVEERYGLDEPIPVQFVELLEPHVCSGTSASRYQNSRSVNEILGEQARRAASGSASGRS